MQDETSSTTITAGQVYRTWAAVRAATSTRKLSADSIEAYRSIWNSWCDFLVSKGRSWALADSGDVRGFLQTLSPSRAGRSQASPVSQTRYFRVLREVYACAVANGWIPLTPVDSDALVAKSEAQDSLVFNRQDWAELYRCLPVVSSAPPSPALSWQALRDHSLLLMMMQAGLTVAELRGLNLASVEHPRLAWTPSGGNLSLPFLPWQPEAQVPVVLHIEGARPAQRRQLTLNSPNDTVLLHWLAVRLVPPFAQDAESPLYVTQKSKAKHGIHVLGKDGGRIAAKSIFLLANQHILRSLQARYGSDSLAHAGPMTLRNSCIVRWMDAGLSDAMVIERAGLKEVQALRRLRHHVHDADVMDDRVLSDEESA